MTLVDHYLYIIGGTSGFTYDMDVNRLDISSLKWEFLSADPSYIPLPR